MTVLDRYFDDDDTHWGWELDDPRYEKYLKDRKFWDACSARWRESYARSLKENPEWHAQFRYNYFEYCLYYRIWHPKSSWHPDSPRHPDHPLYKKFNIGGT